MSEIGEFAALVTGSIAGALMKADHLLIDVEVPTDGEGNYLKEIHVHGRESDTWLRVTVEPMYDTPETVAEKMQGATAAMEAAQKHL